MGAFSKCAECRVCCGKPGGATVTQEEAWTLRNVKTSVEFIKHGDLFRIKDEDGKCPFLDTSSGCVLSDADKPLSCEIWPFYPAKDGGWILRMACPHWNSITNDEFEYIKKVFSQKKAYWNNYSDVRVE